MNLKIAAIVLALVAAFAAGIKVEHDRNKAKRLEEQMAAENQAEVLRLSRQSSINKSATTFAKNAAKSRQTSQSNLAKVEEYAPSTHPPLPGSFRVWHDAAATGEALDGAGGADAPSVSIKDTARTIASNYADARYDQERLTALQAIVKASGCFDVEE